MSDVGTHPPKEVLAPLMLQRWDTVGFVHWRYEAAAVRRAVPKQLEVEEYDGSAWVSMTPFLVLNARFPMLPPLPSMRRYGETNLRTYVRAPNGRRGVWFMALDSSNVPAAVLGRTAYLQPYMWSDLAVDPGPDLVRFSGKRRFPHAGTAYDLTLRKAESLGAGGATELDRFLTGRWNLFTMLGPVVAVAAVSHQPWALYRAEIVELEQDLTKVAGLPAPESEPMAHFSPGVDAKLGVPRPLLGS